MSAQMRILQPTESEAGFELLKDFITLANNPEQITAAHKKMREEAALTEEQQKKYAEALAFMSNYEVRKKEIEDAAADLKNRQNEHARNVEKNNAEYTRKHNELQEWEARNQAKDIELQGNTAQLEKDRQSLANQISQQTEDHAKAMAEVAQREEDAQQEQANNAKYKAELDEYKATLDARAKKLIEVASGG